MEILIGIAVWLTLGALHVPLYKYWWTADYDYTVDERRFSRWMALGGPFSMLISTSLAVSCLLSDRTEDNTVISKRRKT
jgi:hypothetical protein